MLSYPQDIESLTSVASPDPLVVDFSVIQILNMAKLHMGFE